MIFANAGSTAFPDNRVASYLSRMQIVPWAMEAGKTAMEMGSPRSTNLAMIAFYSAFGVGPLNADALRTTVADISPESFRKLNLAIFDACYETGKTMCKG
jgi:Pyruvate/2-oxoacid:ferredoxin oxidoreductase gamma subunit